MAARSPGTATELARVFCRHRDTAGSDGILVGAHPHPRAFGTFAR